MYIGQTTNGIDRFSSHNAINNNKDKIFFFSFEKETNKNLLDYMEGKMIKSIASNKILSNKTEGNNSFIGEKDKQYADLSIDSIKDFMKLFNFNTKEKLKEEIIYEETENKFIFTEKGDLLKSIYNLLKREKDWFTFEEIYSEMKLIYHDDLINKRWKNYDGLKSDIRFNIMKVTKGYSITNEKKLLFNRLKKDNVVKLKIIS